MSQSAASGSLRRVADLVEFLGLLEADLSEGQIDHLQAAIATVLESGLDAFDLTNLAIAAVRGELAVPPDFYVDLFAMIVNAAPTPPMGLSWLLNEFAGIPIDIVEIHPQWIHDAQYEGLRSLGVEIVFWTFSATVETFAAIEQYEPEAVGTSEAQLLVRWLDD
jgi:hypothetical protein